MIALLLSISLLIQPNAEVSGRASYYDATRNNAWYTRGSWDLEFYAAAGPALRKLKPFKWRQPYQIWIYNPKTQRGMQVWVVDWCQCSKGKKSEKLVDLSPKLWQWLCNCHPSRGIQQVQVRVVGLRNEGNERAVPQSR